MNKKEFVSKVMKRTGFTQGISKKAVDAVFEEISECLESGEDVKLVGFATFSTKHRKARNGVSPKDKTKKIHIDEKRVPSVRFGKALKNRINTK